MSCHTKLGNYAVCIDVNLLKSGVLMATAEHEPIMKVSGGVQGQSPWSGSPLPELKSFCLSEVQITRKFAHFWPTVLSVEPMVQYVVCLSVCRLSMTFCIVAKRYVLAKNCLKEWIGNQGQKVDFLGRCHISTSGFTATATKTAVFALFLPVQPSNRY